MRDGAHLLLSWQILARGFLWSPTKALTKAHTRTEPYLRVNLVLQLQLPSPLAKTVLGGVLASLRQRHPIQGLIACTLAGLLPGVWVFHLVGFHFNPHLGPTSGGHYLLLVQQVLLLLDHTHPSAACWRLLHHPSSPVVNRHQTLMKLGGGALGTLTRAISVVTLVVV